MNAFEPAEDTQQSEIGALLQNLGGSYEEVLKKHKQQFYQRENFEECHPEQCKDSEGNWTKWVKERMDIHQDAVYNQVREALLKLDSPLGHLSENHVLRFCDSL